jgi:large repetitive protein
VRRALRLVAFTGAITTALALSTAPAVATHVHCGDTITQSTALDSDLTGCTGDGIVIGAPNVTLDLADHTISGDGGSSQAGIRDSGWSRAVVRNGTIRNFGYGIYFYQANGGHIEHLDITALQGISLLGQPTENVVAANSVTGGIAVGESYWFANQSYRQADNRIEQNIVTSSPSAGGGSGINLNLVDRNVVSQNLVTGGPIVVVGDSYSHNGSDENKITGNTVVSSRTEYDILLAQDCTRNDVAGNQVFGGSIGVEVTVSCNGNFVRENQIRNTGRYGIAVSHNGYSTSGNLLDSNDIANSAVDGIFVSNLATDTIVTQNVAHENGDDGIQIDAAGTGLAQNTANRNGDLGIEAVPGVLDRGGNRAKQNGNPAQCLNVSCSSSGKP